VVGARIIGVYGVRVALLALMASCALPAAAAARRVEVGLESQAYPTGVIGAASVRLPVAGRHRIGFRAGYNRARRSDNGEHDDERGGGPGIGAAYRFGLRPEARGLFFGARVDLWWLEIDWTDDPGLTTEVRGSTDILVLQPTGEVGWRFTFGSEMRWAVEPSVALGAEINVRTEGEDVGEGAILLGGVAVTYRF